MSTLPSNITPADAAPLHAAVPVTLIRPRRRMRLFDPEDFRQHGDLLWLLAMRDVQVRYKQTMLGVFWAMLQPVGMMVVIAVFLGPITGLTDPVTLYAGLLPWTFFASAVNATGSSLVNSAELLRKAYFPRLILPLAALGAPTLDYLIGGVVFAGLMIGFGAAFGPALLLLPLFFVSTALAALGIGLLTAAASVRYRDVRYLLPFALQLLFFATPIIVKHEQMPALLQPVLWLNPVGGTIAATRAAVLGEAVDWAAWLQSVVIAVGLLVAGLAYFDRAERRFADVV